MNSINKLGKISEIIGKIIFYIFLIISILVVISFNLSKSDNNPETSIIIGSILGNILAIILIYYFSRFLFKPIYCLNKNILLKINNQLNSEEYKKKWTISLVCSLIFGLVFIVGTFGISLLVMIPQYILLYRIKNL